MKYADENIQGQLIHVYAQHSGWLVDIHVRTTEDNYFGVSDF